MTTIKIIPKTKFEAIKLAETAMRITAEELQKEFESYFPDSEAQLKLIQLTELMPEEMLKICLLGENRLYLYSILMDNSIEDILADLNRLIEIEKK